MGSPEFAAKVASFSGYSSFLEEIGKAEVEIDQWQLLGEQRRAGEEDLDRLIAR